MVNKGIWVPTSSRVRAQETKKWISSMNCQVLISQIYLSFFLSNPPKIFSLRISFVSWSFWLFCPSLLSCKMEKSICVDSGLKGRWLCKQNPMLQMCLLNCHMCGVAGQNYITCWEGLGIYSSVTQFRMDRIQRNCAKLQNCPNFTYFAGIIRVLDFIHQRECSTFLVRCRWSLS